MSKLRIYRFDEESTLSDNSISSYQMANSIEVYS